MTQKKYGYKKSQGLSITTIIIAAMALIVLVVLIAIFTGRIGFFSKGIQEVTSVCKLPGSKRVCCSSGSINEITNTDQETSWTDCPSQGCCTSLVERSSSGVTGGEEVGTRNRLTRIVVRT